MSEHPLTVPCRLNDFEIFLGLRSGLAINFGHKSTKSLERTRHAENEGVFVTVRQQPLFQEKLLLCTEDPVFKIHAHD